MHDQSQDMGRNPDTAFEPGSAARRTPANRTVIAGLKLLKALVCDILELAVRLRYSLIKGHDRGRGRAVLFRRGGQPGGKRIAEPRRWLSSSDLDARRSVAWLLLTYKLPPEPAATQVELWRRLKGMGAVYLQNGVCLLPRTDEHIRRLKVFEHQIHSSGGDAIVLGVFALDSTRKERVVSRFTADCDEAYREFMVKCDRFEAEIANGTAAQRFSYAEIEKYEVDLSKLRDWLDRLDQLDFYGAGLAGQAASRFRQCENLLDRYAQSVFDATEATDLIHADPSLSNQRAITSPNG